MTADSARRPSSVSLASSSPAFRKRSGYLSITCQSAVTHTYTHTGFRGLVLVGDNLHDTDRSTGTCIHGFYALIQHSGKVRQHAVSLLLFVHGV